MARVLIVENDQDLARMLGKCLITFGRIVIVAQSGPLALKEVGFDFPIDIALLDVHLTGMDGFEVLEELRRHPELDNPKLPAVFLSGDKNHDIIQRAHDMGCTFLPKPFVHSELQGALLVALNGLPDPEQVL